MSIILYTHLFSNKRVKSLTNMFGTGPNLVCTSGLHFKSLIQDALLIRDCSYTLNMYSDDVFVQIKIPYRTLKLLRNEFQILKLLYTNKFVYPTAILSLLQILNFGDHVQVRHQTYYSSIFSLKIFSNLQSIISA